MISMDDKIKAELLSIGTVNAEASLLPPPRTSTAGPGMGLQSVFFTSGGLRVRLEVTKDSPLNMVPIGWAYVPPINSTLSSARYFFSRSATSGNFSAMNS